MMNEAFFAGNNWLIWVAVLWSLPWKGMALWRAAQRRETGWFIALFIVNTVGLLDMIYLFIVSKRRPFPALRKNKDEAA
ncbi:MAG: DUF5652 family protein [Candidatus Jorgensenbacteria bacterium]